MSLQTLRRVTEGIIILTAVVWIGYDFLAYFLGGPEATISRVFNEGAMKFPIVTLLIGIILGHMFWPVKRQPDLKG